MVQISDPWMADRCTYDPAQGVMQGVSKSQPDLQTFHGGDPPSDVSKQIGCHAHPAQIKGLDPTICRVLD